MRNVLQVSWFNNAYSHEYTLLLYTRVVRLVSRCLIHIRANTHYFHLMYSCRTRGTTRCCLVTPRPRPPLVWKIWRQHPWVWHCPWVNLWKVDKDRFERNETRCRKERKGVCNQDFSKGIKLIFIIICKNFVTILIMYSITPRELKLRIFKIFKITINFFQ